MFGKVFQGATNKKGLLGIKCKFRPAVTLVSYKSPYATVKQNDWLERKLVKVYSSYYYKVLLSTCGRFWEEMQPATSKQKSNSGGASNDVQLEEFIRG